jgi:hypothetical protein
VNTSIRLYGEVEGTIWMPSAVCTKSFDVRLVRIARDARTRVAHAHGWPWEISELRDALLSLTNDGDFQSCSITWAVLEVSYRKGSKTITRTWEVRGTGTNADCFASATL